MNFKISYPNLFRNLFLPVLAFFSVGAFATSAASFSPASLDGLILWLDGDDPSSMVVDDDSRVSVWSDKSPEAHRALRDSPTQQPVYIPDFLNGRGVVRFNGSNSLILGQPESLNFTGEDSFTFFAVVNSRNNGSVLAKTTGGTMQYRFHIPGERTLRVRLGVGGDERDTVSVTGSDNFSLLSVVNQDVGEQQQFHLFFDGELENSGISGSGMVDANTIVGGRDDAGTAQRLNFDLAEMIIVARDLDEEERVAVERYLSRKFGLANRYASLVVESLYPIFGFQGHLPVEGLQATVTLGEGVALADVGLILNGVDRTAEINVESDGSNRIISFIGELSSGTEYEGSFSVISDDGFELLIPLAFNTIQPEPITFDPSSIPGLTLWMDGNDPSSMVFDADGRIETWLDKSSLAHEASRDTATQRPIHVPGVVNGRGVVRFSGGQSLLLGQPEALDFTGQDDFTFFGVVNSRNNGSVLAKTTGGTMQYRFHIPGGRTLRVRLGGGGQERDTVSVTGPDYFSLLSVLNQNVGGVQQFQLFFDGELENSGVSGSGTVDANAVIAGRDNAGTAQRLNADFAELLLFNRALTEAEKLEIELYLTLKFGLETNLSPVVVESVVPADGTIFANPTDGIELVVRNVLPGVGEIAGIRFELDGQDLSGALDTGIVGDVWTSRYSAIEANRIYEGIFVVTTLDGFIREIPVRFDTFSLGNFTFEAEDYNFDAGQFIDDPKPSGFFNNQFINPGEGYLDRRGQQRVDFLSHDPRADDQGFVGSPEANHIYRIYDVISTREAPDFQREKYIQEGVPDYYVHGLSAGEWLNYTRTFPAGDYHAYVRAGGDLIQYRLDRVLGPVTGEEQDVEFLGFFNEERPTGGSFGFVPLRNNLGGLARISLFGGVETLRVTALAGGSNLNFFMLVPASPQAPLFGGFSPRNGGRFAAVEEGISFVIHAPEGFEPGWFSFLVNDVDLTSELTFVTEGETVVGTWSGLEPDRFYQILLRIEDPLFGPIEQAWSFDTIDFDLTPPDSIEGLILWLDANNSASLVLDGNNRVSQWSDLSGRGNHAMQSDPLKQPLWLDDDLFSLNGMPILRFDGNNDHLTLGDRPDLDLDPQGEFTFFTLVRARNNGSIFARTLTDATYQYRFHVPTERHFRANIGSSVGSAGSVNTTTTLGSGFGLLSGVNRNIEGVVSTEMFFNGQLEGVGPSGFTTIDGTTIIGARGPEGTEQPLNFDLPEIILFNRALNPAERRQIEEYLILKYLLDIVLETPGIVAPVLRDLRIEEGEIRFTFYAHEGFFYRIEASTLLDANSWLTVEIIEGSCEDIAVAFPIDGTLPSLFLRVVVTD